MQQLNIHLSTRSNKVLLRYSVEGEPLGFEDRLLDFEAIAEQVKKAERDYYTSIPADLQKVGKALYDWLDDDDRYLERAIAKMANDQLLALAFEGEGELLHLPWELLHDGKQFLVQNLSPEIVPVRLKKGNTTLRSPQDRALQLLFMATSPRNVQPELDFEGEEVRILDATKRLPLNLEVEESGNLEELHYLLGQMGPETVDVVHLSGHAHHEPTPHFLTEDENGNKLESTADDFKECFDGYRPSLLFLSGCSTGRAKTDETEAMPSLAEELLNRAFPAILAWAQPVYEKTATEAASHLYEALSEGLPIPKALHKTLSRLLIKPEEFPDWHLLRLYANGSVPENLKTTRRHAKRVALNEKAFLDEEQRKVPVATRRSFVGRRRKLQDCLKVLRTQPEYYGIVLHGTGGLGKSSIAARLSQRLEHTYHAIVHVGVLDELVLLRKLGFDQNQQVEELSASFKEAFMANGTGKRLLLVLDDFEQNFEQEDGNPKTFGPDKQVRLTPKAAEILKALLKAIHECQFNDQAPQLFITSRYTFQLTGSGDQPGTRVLKEEALTGFRPEEWRRFQNRQETKGLGGELVANCERVADGNPRLLEWLLEVLRNGKDLDSQTLLAQLEAKKQEFRERVLAQYLWDLQSHQTKKFLWCLALFNIPVPLEVLAQYTEILDADKHIRPAVNLALVEQYKAVYGEEKPHYHLAEVFSKLVPEPTEADFYKAADVLGKVWSDVKTESQLQELTQLGIKGKNEGMLNLHGETYVIFLERSQRFREAAQVGNDILKITSKNSSIIVSTAQALHILGANEFAFRLLKEGREIFLNKGFEDDVLLIENSIAGIYLHKGDFKMASQLWESVESIYRRKKINDIPAAILHNLAVCYLHLNKNGKALKKFEESLSINTEANNDRARSANLNQMAEIYKRRDDHKKAYELYKLSLSIRKRSHDERGEATTLYQMAVVLEQTGDYNEALRLYQESLVLSEKVGDYHQSSMTLLMAGNLMAFEFQKYPEAWGMVLEGSQIVQGTQSHHLEMAKNITFNVLMTWVKSELGESLLWRFEEMFKENIEQAFNWLREQGLEV